MNSVNPVVAFTSGLSTFLTNSTVLQMLGLTVAIVSVIISWKRYKLDLTKVEEAKKCRAQTPTSPT